MAHRSVWISSCETGLFLETGAPAAQYHAGVATHGRRGLFMVYESQRILNEDVADEGVWQADISKCKEEQEGGGK